MPNNTRIPYCPFYKDERNSSISCEDTYHVFMNPDEKYAWMDLYCDGWDWMRCPYAVDLSEAYARYEKGDVKALEKQKIEAMKKELKSLSSKLGKAEKRIERMKKKIDELRAVNQSFVKKNENLEKLRRQEYAHRRALQEKIDKGDEEIVQQLQTLGVIYEQRMCYLIENFAPGQIMVESDVEAWAGERSFALVHDADEEHGRFWKVIYQENEDGEDDIRRVSGDDTEESASEQVQQ